MDNVEYIEIDNLEDHPSNPRLVWREDVIDGIAAQLAESGGFDPAHALLVRPVNGHYQIVRGHHRKRAAVKAGLTTVPCWVRPMTDEEAYTQLALGNVQGELAPLELGVWVLGNVEDAQGGRGIEGGTRQIARTLGRSHQYLSQLRSAAQVYAVVNTGNSSCQFLDKAKHLSAISQAPRRFWRTIVDLMFAQSLPVVLVEQHVEVAKYIEANVPPEMTWLDGHKLLRNGVSRETIGRIVSMVEAIEALIQSYRVDHGAFLQEFHDWLPCLQSDGGDIRKIADYQRDLQKRLVEAEREPAYITESHYATWLDVQTECDLLLTDPPYMTDVDDIERFAAEWLPKALKKVKRTGRAYVCIGAYPRELAAYLNVRVPEHIELAQVLVWTYRNTLGPSSKLDYNLNWQAILYYRGKDAPPLDCPVKMDQFAVQDMVVGEHYHTWQKPDELAERFIMHSTKPNDLVLDPFGGTGTFILAASRLGRKARGCDNSADMIEIAIRRGCVRYET